MTVKSQLASENCEKGGDCDLAHAWDGSSLQAFQAIRPGTNLVGGYIGNGG